MSRSEDTPEGTSLTGLVGSWRTRWSKGRSFGVKPAPSALGAGEVEARLAVLGDHGKLARLLDESSERLATRLVSLSPLSSGLALDYIERLLRPIPSLTPELGVSLVTRAYTAHLAAEEAPSAFAAPGMPALDRLPPLKRGRPPQDLLNRVVKASRRRFSRVRGIPAEVWEGFVVLQAARVHHRGEGELLAVEVVDGLARFGWVLRQVDKQYGLEPEIASG